MALEPSRSWRNVAAVPPLTTVSIHVDVPPLIHNNDFQGNNDAKKRTFSEDFILRCFAESMYLSGVDFDDFLWERYFYYQNYEEALGTFVYEDMTLREMSSPASPSYRLLETNLKWIADTLSCNVSVFVGHVETCQSYLEDVYLEAMRQVQLPSSLPTVFLIIACKSDELAQKMNTESRFAVFRQHNIGFFGFKDLLHIHQGELYSTKLFDTARSKAICDSEEMVGLFGSLRVAFELAGIDAVQTPIEPQVILDIYRNFPDLDIFKCCKAKLGRLYSDFVKGLERRETTKYPKELLVKKFRPFVERTNRNLLLKSYTTITPADGLDCQTNDCQIPNLYTAEELLAQEYNRKGAFHTLFRELKSIMNVAYVYPDKRYNSEDEYIASIEQFFRKIQGLKGKEMSVFTYTPNLDRIAPILFDLIWTQRNFETDQYPLIKTLRFILQKYGASLDFSIQSPATGNTFLHQLLKANKFSEKEEYILFKTIFDAIPEKEEKERIFFLKDNNGNICIANDTKFRPLLYLFYIENFGSKLKDVTYKKKQRVGNLLHAVLENPISATNTEKDLLVLECVQGLLSAGVNPNQKIKEEISEYTPASISGTDPITIGQLYTETKKIIEKQKPLELFADLYYPPYNETLFTSFLRYGMTNDTLFFTKQKEYYYSLRKPANVQSLDKILASIEEYLYTFAGDYANGPQWGGMPAYYSNNNYSPPNSPYSRDSNNLRNKAYRYSDFDDLVTRRLTVAQKQMYDEKIKLYILYREHWNTYITNIQGIRIPATRMKIYLNTYKLYSKALLSRKGIKKHGSKVRRTYKSNKETLNKTIKNRFNSILFNVNGEKMVGDLLGKIMELAKRPQFTKEEKANYKKRPFTISKSNLQPREKYDRLKEIYEQMETTLKTR